MATASATRASLDVATRSPCGRIASSPREASWYRWYVLLGLNYPFPWNAYGRYFGGGCPPGQEPDLDRWLHHLDENLGRLRDELGIGVVRIFLLCNALNYGAFASGRRVGAPGEPLVLPEQLHPRFGEHLAQMLASFRRRGLRVIPSLLDFKALGRPHGSNGCTGRTALASEPVLRQRFVSQVLGELLLVAREYSDEILAFEVINEPTWNLRRFTAPRSAAGGRTLGTRELSAFLALALGAIEEAGLSSTVGHRFARDLARFPTGTVRQFHYYPASVFGRAVLDRRLLPFAVTRAILGEFGIRELEGGEGSLWPELHGADADSVEQRVRARVDWVESRGYEVALLWPDGIDGRGGRTFPPGPDPLQLSAAAQKALGERAKAER